MNQKRTQRGALSREKWLELAMDAMASECKSKFSLDSLLKAMPISKGSFYWHFKNRTEFLEALVDFWDRRETQSIIQALDSLPQTASAEDVLWELMCEIQEFENNRHELLIRSLAMEYPELQKVIDKVDRNRLDTILSLFSQMGFDGHELEMRAWVFMISTGFEEMATHELGEKARLKQLRLRHEFFCRR